MCGIFCSFSNTHHEHPKAEVAKRLIARGPDSQNNVTTIYRPCAPAASNDVAQITYVTLHSTVLSLRGSITVSQPLQDCDKRFTLCWNGEAWTIDGKRPHGNDTLLIQQLLVDSLTRSPPTSDAVDAREDGRKVAQALSRIAGPYAFVFFDNLRARVYFGRDFLGRRSLLSSANDRGDLLITSVTDGSSAAGWTEIEADGVYVVDLDASDSHYDGFTPLRIPYEFDDQPTGNHGSVIPRLSLNKITPSQPHCLSEGSPAVARLETLLRNSLTVRVTNIPQLPVDITPELGKAKLAILFSGGLDCTVLARLAHDLLPAEEHIDLLNVAFENPRIHKPDENRSNPEYTPYELCPDRITGRSSYAELVHACPRRQWRFVAINVPYTETLDHRETVVSLMHPHNTEMDLSIASALYFAARGLGQINDAANGITIAYTSIARVLISGLGADEIFAGYTRHATAYRRGGFEALLEEMEIDVARLGKRNLGRDDRVMSHWGKEVRFPYLDEDLLTWALNASVDLKCGFGESSKGSETSSDELSSASLPPDKKVLRCLASKLGMPGVAREKKRAIQFGARTAKMEAGKTKGTHLIS